MRATRPLATREREKKRREKKKKKRGTREERANGRQRRSEGRKGKRMQSLRQGTGTNRATEICWWYAAVGGRGTRTVYLSSTRLVGSVPCSALAQCVPRTDKAYGGIAWCKSRAARLFLCFILSGLLPAGMWLIMVHILGGPPPQLCRRRAHRHIQSWVDPSAGAGTGPEGC